MLEPIGSQSGVPDGGHDRAVPEIGLDSEARGREKFDALFNGKRIVQAGSQPISDAARILHRLGHDDDVLLVARHHGADHDAIRGPLGVWRHLRVREDRGGPRFAKWEPFPLRPEKRAHGSTRRWHGALPAACTIDYRCFRPGAQRCLGDYPALRKERRPGRAVAEVRRTMAKQSRPRRRKRELGAGNRPGISASDRR
jgi:hypothetical protein